MKINGKYMVRRVGKQYFAVALDAVSPTDSMIRLNESGAYIFERIIEGLDTDEIIGKLTEEFDVPRETACEDVVAFISFLRQAKIVD